MDIHKYKFVTIVNDVEAPLSLCGSQRMGQFVTEKDSLFTPDTLTTPQTRRKVPKRTRARAGQDPIRVGIHIDFGDAQPPTSFTGSFSPRYSALLSRGLKIKRNDDGLIFREFTLHANCRGSLNAVVLDYHRLFCGTVILVNCENAEKDETRGDASLDCFFESDMKLARDCRRTKSENHV